MEALKVEGVEWPRFTVRGSLVTVEFLVPDTAGSGSVIRTFVLSLDQAYELMMNLKALMREKPATSAIEASRMFLEGIRIGMGQYGRHAS